MLYTSIGNVSRADIGSEAKIPIKINWFLSKQKDLSYSTIIMMRLPANRCVLEISHQPDSPDLGPAEIFCSIEGKPLSTNKTSGRQERQQKCKRRIKCTDFVGS
jgi:hypothetical protein